MAEAEASMTSTTTEDAAIAESAVVRNRVDPDLEGEQEETYDDEGNPVEPEPEPEFLTKEEFRASFIALHDAPAMMLDPDFHVFSIPEPQGHMIADMRYQGACSVADRMYDRCAANGAPDWLKNLIRSDKSALMDWAAIGMYGFGFVRASQEFKHIKQARAAEAANNDAPPEFQTTRTEDAA